MAAMMPRDVHLLRPRTRRIQRHGDPAVGVVVTSRPGRGDRQVLTIRAALPGGGEQTLTRTVRGVPPLAGGARVPLRYDRTKPEQVEVDVDALLHSAP